MYAVLKVYEYLLYGPVAQLVRAPPCHGGGREFESLLGRLYGILAQLGEHLPYKQRVIGSSPIGPIDYGWIPEWPKGADCKSVGNAFEGSNPSPSIRILLRKCIGENKPKGLNLFSSVIRDGRVLFFCPFTSEKCQFVQIVLKIFSAFR